MKKSTSIRTLIKDLEPDELREVILELSKLSKKNKQFLEVFLQSSEAADVESIVSEAKQKIYNFFFGRSAFPKIDLANARKTVNEYSKLLKDYPGHIADLKLYYVEVGTELTNEFGDIDERFYSSLESMFKGFCKHIEKHPVYYNQFKSRIEKLESACYGTGWGYFEVISDLAFELDEKM